MNDHNASKHFENVAMVVGCEKSWWYEEENNEFGIVSAGGLLRLQEKIIFQFMEPSTVD
jgi:hypothetical protein